MFQFMEGLPGSGKSFETCVYYILPSIIKGRPVDAYVEGLNHEMFAELSGKTLEEVQELLVFIPSDDVREIYKYARKDALIVIDELQDFFQAGRQKLSDEITRFVSQHRHEGQDIIAMGQDLNDVHNIFRRRCDRKFVFTKQDAIGRPNHYKWASYKGQRTARDIKFVEISSGSREYEEKFFGLYKSHSDGTSNFESFEDSRTNVFSGKGLRYGIPFAIFVLSGAIWYLKTSVFGGDGITGSDQVQVDDSALKSDKFSSLESQFETIPVQPLEPEKPQTEQSTPTEYIDDLASKYRLRLTGVMNLSGSKDAVIYMQAFDSTMHLMESMNSIEIAALGWDVELTTYGALLSKGDTQYVLRQWPMETQKGKVNKRTVEQL
jgi:zona occludens toxin